MTDNQYWKDWRARNKEHIAAYNKSRAVRSAVWSHQRNWRQKLRIMAYLGGHCMDCGLQHDGQNECVFDVHHINPDEKEFSLAGSAKDWTVIKAELDKCVLLCANCHRLRHAKNKSLNHEVGWG